MLKKWIYDTTIILQDSVESWPQALELCAKPLLDLQVIAPEYVTAIIEQHHMRDRKKGRKDLACHY